MNQKKNNTFSDICFRKKDSHPEIGGFIKKTFTAEV